MDAAVSSSFTAEYRAGGSCLGRDEIDIPISVVTKAVRDSRNVYVLNMYECGGEVKYSSLGHSNVKWKQGKIVLMRKDNHMEVSVTGQLDHVNITKNATSGHTKIKKLSVKGDEGRMYVEFNDGTIYHLNVKKTSQAFIKLGKALQDLKDNPRVKGSLLPPHNTTPQHHTISSQVSPPTVTIQLKPLPPKSQLYTNMKTFSSPPSNEYESDEDEWLNSRKSRGSKSVDRGSAAFYGKQYNDSRQFQISASAGPTRKRTLGLLPTPSSKRRCLSETYTWTKNRSFTSPDVDSHSLHGFSNLGNTCYMNAILQSLDGLDCLTADLLSCNKGQLKMLPQDTLFYNLYRLLRGKRRPDVGEKDKRELLRNVKNAISTSAKRFSGNEQHDAHEFLSQVLDQLKEEVIKLNKTTPNGSRESTPVNAALPKDTQPIVNATIDTFQFDILHTIKCTECDEELSKTEQFNDLSIEIPRHPSGKEVSLQDALDTFFHEEKIEYTCSECPSKSSMAAHTFTKLPRVLIVHVKRYLRQSSKMSQSLLIPKYITLQSHCVDTTVPANRPSVNCLRLTPPKADSQTPEPARRRLDMDHSTSKYKFKRTTPSETKSSHHRPPSTPRHTDHHIRMDDLDVTPINKHETFNDGYSDYILPNQTADEMLQLALQNSMCEASSANFDTSGFSDHTSDFNDHQSGSGHDYYTSNSYRHSACVATKTYEPPFVRKDTNESDKYDEIQKITPFKNYTMLQDKNQNASVGHESLDKSIRPKRQLSYDYELSGIGSKIDKFTDDYSSDFESNHNFAFGDGFEKFDKDKMLWDNAVKDQKIVVIPNDKPSIRTYNKTKSQSGQTDFDLNDVSAENTDTSKQTEIVRSKYFDESESCDSGHEDLKYKQESSSDQNDDVAPKSDAIMFKQVVNVSSSDDNDATPKNEAKNEIIVSQSEDIHNNKREDNDIFKRVYDNTSSNAISTTELRNADCQTDVSNRNDTSLLYDCQTDVPNKNESNDTSLLYDGMTQEQIEEIFGSDYAMDVDMNDENIELEHKTRNSDLKIEHQTHNNDLEIKHQSTSGEIVNEKIEEDISDKTDEYTVKLDDKKDEYSVKLDEKLKIDEDITNGHEVEMKIIEDDEELPSIDNVYVSEKKRSGLNSHCEADGNKENEPPNRADRSELFTLPGSQDDPIVLDLSPEDEDERRRVKEEEELRQAKELSLREFEESQMSISSDHEPSTVPQTEVISRSPDEKRAISNNYDEGSLPHSYRLVGVVSHLGSSSIHGHYISDVYDIKKKAWFSYDDRHVTKITEREVCQSRQRSGYIYFYICRNVFENLSSTKS